MKEYYKQEYEETLDELKTSKSGLSNEEAKVRLQKYGHNKLKETKKKSIFIMFLSQFKDAMLIILIISAIISGFVSIRTGETITDSIIILFVVLLNAILGVMQESKAEKAIEALKEMSLPYIKVRRNGKIESIKTEELVKGDICLVEAGDTIPADMQIIESHSLRVEESALTGESVAVDKKDKFSVKNDTKVALADRINMLYSGSSVVYGRGEAVVVATAMETELGKIAEAISTQKTEITPLQKKINELSRVLSVIVVLIAIVMFVIGYLKGNPPLDVFMLAVSLAVAAIPEGLSAVITITLAMGVQKMAKEKAIVRKLSAVEALGSTEVICSDKTGTLTQNKMTLRNIYIDGKLLDIENISSFDEIENIDGIYSEDVLKLANVAVLCNDTTFGEDGGRKILLGDPTETCIIEFCSKIGFDKEVMDKTFKRVDEVPFDSTRKMMTTVNSMKNEEKMVCTKGAVESILEVCKYVLLNGKVENLTSKMKDEILENNLQMAKNAIRVLACAYKIENGEIDKNEEDLIFIGLIGMIDPPRKEAKRAVERCFNAGIIPVMITGDNIVTAKAIAKELGIYNEGVKAITGVEIDAMSDEELYNEVENIRVYARVSPENKVRIVKAWKKHGKIVAMTGDGVNDAPALKGADIGVGMGITGTEVSKSVSSMVLADDNFATIVVAVKEGRRIFNNIQNVIAYLLASNLAEVFIVFFATLFDKVLLLPTQILWINLITDTLPAIALGFEKEERGLMKQKPKSSQKRLFTPFLTCRILIPGIIKAVVILSMYFILEKNYGASIASGAIFITLSVIEMLFAFVCRSDKKSIFKIGVLANKPMIFCILGAFILQLIIIFVPVLSTWLAIPKMPTTVYIAIITTTLITVSIFEIIKILLGKIFKEK